MTDESIPGAIRPNLEEEADRVIQWATRRGVVLRTLGGVAVKHYCLSSEKPDFLRQPGDLDFVALGRQRKEVGALFEELGYKPEKGFNALHGRRRLLFTDPEGERDIDVLLDVFQMSHVLPLVGRLEVDDWAISVSDLLLTKLQIAEINRKDMRDAACVLVDHPLSRGEQRGHIDMDWIAHLCASDWGLDTTVVDNLTAIEHELPQMVSDEGDRAVITQRIERLRSVIESEPKSLRWRMRAGVGRRVRWYEVPEEARLQGPIKLE